MSVRIAAFQRFPIFDDEAASIAALLHDLRWAEAYGVDLALFPECHLLGHAYRQAAIEARARRIDDAMWSLLLAKLKPITTSVIIGCIERHDDRITNSAFLVENGHISGRYANAFPNEDGITAGEHFPVFSRSGVTFGINICNDANHAYPAQRLADRSAALICYPLNNMLDASKAEKWRSKSIQNLRSRARQTGCWIMSADVTGYVDEKVSFGCTMILDPNGRIVARAAELSEGVAMFDLPPRSV